MDSAAVLLGIRRKLTPDFFRLFFKIIPIFWTFLGSVLLP